MSDTFDPADVVKTIKSESSSVAEPTTEKSVKKVVSTPVPTHATSTNSVKKSITPAKVARKPVSGSERAYDSIVNYLEKFRLAKYGSKEKIQSLERILDVVTKFPKKIILDTILEFFIEHKDEEFLDEYHALQGITECEPSNSMKIRILYYLMINLARRTASKKNISIDVIKNIFKKEDLSVWVIMQLRGR